MLFIAWGAVLRIPGILMETENAKSPRNGGLCFFERVLGQGESAHQPHA